MPLGWASFIPLYPPDEAEMYSALEPSSLYLEVQKTNHRWGSGIETPTSGNDG